jgi:hypothetical protein
MIVTTRHLFTITGYSARRGFCRDRSKAFFRSHGLDWRDFVRDGIDEAALLATGDGLAVDLVQWARICEAHHAFASDTDMTAAVAEWRAHFAGGARGR